LMNRKSDELLVPRLRYKEWRSQDRPSLKSRRQDCLHHHHAVILPGARFIRGKGKR
jgi:hypothetical protein